MVTLVDKLKTEIEYLRFMEKETAPVVGESGLIVSDLERMQKALSTCGRVHTRRRNISTGEAVTVAAYTCQKNKFCAHCADGEYMRRMAALDRWYIENRDSVDSCYLVTFTQQKREGETAGAAARRILDSFRSFQRIGQAGRSKEYSKILSGFRSMEIEYSASGFHAHLHAVVFTSEPLDYRVYKSKVKYEVQKELAKVYGWNRIPEEIFDSEMEKRGGYLHEDRLSSISREWVSSGEGNKSIDVKPLFSKYQKPFSLRSNLQGSKEVAKRVRYSLKYAMKDNDFSTLPDGVLFQLIDGMAGVRKNQYLGGLGKYELEEQKEDDFEYNDHLYEVKKIGLKTSDCVEEKIIREQLPFMLEDAQRKARESVQFMLWRRRELLQYFRAGLVSSEEYCTKVDSGYTTMKTEIKTELEHLRNSAEIIRNRMKIKSTVWELAA